MKENIKREAVAGIDDALIRAAYKPEKEAAPTGERRHTGLKRVVLIAAAAVLTVCGLLMFNASIRAAVLGVFVWQEDDHTVLKFADPDSESESTEYKSVYDVTVGYVPDGFTVEDIDCAVDPDCPVEACRVIDLLDESAEDPYNNAPRFVRVSLYSSRLHEQEFYMNEEFEDLYSHTTIKGMDAFVWNSYDYYMPYYNEHQEEIDMQSAQAGKVFDPNILLGGTAIFGDSDVTVKVSGYGISIDELIRIAESVVW